MVDLFDKKINSIKKWKNEEKMWKKEIYKLNFKKIRILTLIQIKNIISNYVIHFKLFFKKIISRKEKNIIKNKKYPKKGKK